MQATIKHTTLQSCRAFLCIWHPTEKKVNSCIRNALLVISNLIGVASCECYFFSVGNSEVRVLASHPTAMPCLVRVLRHPEPQRRLLLMAANRTRNKAITLRMTADELAAFKSHLKRSGARNQTDFVLRLLKNKPISVNYELLAILAELKRQGNNLNQITRQLNQGTMFGDSAKKLLNECWKTYRKIQGEK